MMARLGMPLALGHFDSAHARCQMGPAHKGKETTERKLKDEQTTPRARAASSGAPPTSAPSAPAPLPPPSPAIGPDCLLTRRSEPILPAPGCAPDFAHALDSVRRHGHRLPAHR